MTLSREQEHTYSRIMLTDCLPLNQAHKMSKKTITDFIQDYNHIMS